MNGVRYSAFACVWLFAGAALTGCASSSGQSPTTARSVFVSIDGGVAGIDVDTIDGALEVEDDISPSVQLGLGYQVHENAAVEVRVGDLGSVEFTDGREVSYQHADLSGLLMWRQRNASLFGRLGVGSFDNGGDFDVDLDTTVHAVIGGGLAYHALPNLDIRLSLTAHSSDAIVGSAGLVWRFGGKASSAPRVASDPVSNADGFEPIAPVAREEVTPVPAPSPIASRQDTNNGLVIDEKPIPTLQTFPEPTTPGIPTPSSSASVNRPPLQVEQATVTESVAPEPPSELTVEPATEPAPEPTVISEVDAVNIPEEPAGDLFVVDTLLDVKPLQFATGEIALLDNSALDLEEIASILRSNPTLRLQVESHAAPVGNAELNMLLSRRRALTVISLLRDQGIDVIRLRPRAFGDTAPLADAESVDDNDRVEFRVR